MAQSALTSYCHSHVASFMAHSLFILLILALHPSVLQALHCIALHCSSSLSVLPAASASSVHWHCHRHSSDPTPPCRFRLRCIQLLLVVSLFNFLRIAVAIPPFFPCPHSTNHFNSPLVYIPAHPDQPSLHSGIAVCA